MRTLIYKLKLYGLKSFIFFAYWEVLMQFRHFFLNSYSQGDEDVILDKLLHHKQNGLYIDVGAYDPVRFSNTMRFYRRGWHGINIEPDYEQFQKLSSVRTRDINLNIGISSNRKALTYWVMNPKTLSTFSSIQVKKYKGEGFQIDRKIRVQVLPLSSVIEKYAKQTVIDILTVDVEGSEFDVLKSNNWNKYRPHILCIELSFQKGDLDAEVKRKKSIIRLIESKHYKFAAKTITNYLYIDQKS